MTQSFHVWSFISFYFTITWYVVQVAQDELNAVVVIFRHGDRPPFLPYPTSPYRNVSFWPVDFAQLTNKGKRQHLQLGRWLRTRYQHFLSSIYSRKDIYILSTDVDRTLMSAGANLAGLYPPVANQIWDEDIKWQPIPIHTIPEEKDALLAAKKVCPKYNRLLKQLFKTQYFRNITHQNRHLYAYLTKYAGQTISSPITVRYLYNTLEIETLYNFTLPDWAQKVFPTKLQPLTFLGFAVPTYTPELARLKVGPLLNHIISFFKNHTVKNTESPKFLMFSAHETTVANVLNSLGAFEYHAPPYASTILFELRKSSNGRNYVNLYYKNSTEARLINVRKCDFSCNLSDFINILKPVTVSLDNWENECKQTNSWPLNLEGNVILICVLLVVVLLITEF